MGKGFDPFMNDAITHRLAQISSDILAGEESPMPTVREFLSWAGAERRGTSIVIRLQKLLNENALATIPDFESAYIDSQISFARTDQADNQPIPGAANEPVAEITSETSRPSPRHLYLDPAYRISKLEAANIIPESVKPDEPLQVATTKMLARGYSQLPVMTNERNVKGIITWAGIGSRLALGTCTGVQPVRDFMDQHTEVSSTASLFEVIGLIAQTDHVLVRAEDGRITGVITASDISLQFRQLTEPFLILGEIENNVRRLIGQHFSLETLKTVLDPEDAERQIEGVFDLTFGEYIRLLQNPANWELLGLQIDRATFTSSLDSVRLIRNDVMHFDPDGIASNRLEELRTFSGFLQRLHALKAI
jgi:CBS domain-containing protein